ncbi:MAG: serine/threonine protein kinase [Marinosulfonomonas sp.]|nr:serine/threonine protein kinase [Marinosulfonomonas sp.]
MNSVQAIDGTPDAEFTDVLKPGTTLLHGQFTIDRFLNSGGFGMTYLASDSLERRVVIKECFPASFCSRSDTLVRARSRAKDGEFRSIVKLFVQEARRLAKLKHPNIVGVHQVFEDNETAYMALDLVDGKDLLEILDDDLRKLQPAQIRDILVKLLDAVAFVHDQNILHRDISPDNIILDSKGNPVLIDFGAAREKASKSTRALSALIVVKDGYSPQEFYIAGSEQGRSSDLYALAATFYHLIVGHAPPVSQARLAAVAADEKDPFEPIPLSTVGYNLEFLAALNKALSLFPKDRIQSAQDWLSEIDIEKRREIALQRAQHDKKTEHVISKLVIETNQAVLEALQVEENVSKIPPKPEPKVNPLAAKFADMGIENCPAVKPKETELKEDEPGNPPEPGIEEEIPDQPKRWVFKGALSKRSMKWFWTGEKSRSDYIGKAGP